MKSTVDQAEQARHLFIGTSCRNIQAQHNKFSTCMVHGSSECLGSCRLPKGQESPFGDFPPDYTRPEDTTKRPECWFCQVRRFAGSELVKHWLGRGTPCSPTWGGCFPFPPSTSIPLMTKTARPVAKGSVASREVAGSAIAGHGDLDSEEHPGAGRTRPRARVSSESAGFAGKPLLGVMLFGWLASWLALCWLLVC